MNPQDLPQAWRSEAGHLRELGAEAQARALEWCAEELEQAQREEQLEELTLQEAADASGFSYSAIQKMVSNGELTNVGEKGSPRIRRGDLPRKPTKQQPELEEDGPEEPAFLSHRGRGHAVQAGRQDP